MDRNLPSKATGQFARGIVRKTSGYQLFYPRGRNVKLLEAFESRNIESFKDYLRKEMGMVPGGNLKDLSSFHVSHYSDKSVGIKAMVALILLVGIVILAATTYKAGLWYSKPVQMVPDHRLPSPSATAIPSGNG